MESVRTAGIVEKVGVDCANSSVIVLAEVLSVVSRYVVDDSDNPAVVAEISLVVN